MAAGFDFEMHRDRSAVSQPSCVHIRYALPTELYGHGSSSNPHEELGHKIPRETSPGHSCSSPSTTSKSPVSAQSAAVFSF